MPSLIDIRRRIRSVKNTQQITKAMKMVSAAKLRRAQERVIAARPYAALLREMLAESWPRRQRPMSARVGIRCWRGAPRSASTAGLDHQRQGPGGRLQFQPDQGRAAVSSPSTPDAEITLTLIGRKGRDFFRKRERQDLSASTSTWPPRPTYEDAAAIARKCHRALPRRRDRRGLSASTTNSRA